ncbi:hypothetical protein OQA88_4752 [Cercophora sp. LCS_1]
MFGTRKTMQRTNSSSSISSTSSNSSTATVISNSQTNGNPMPPNGDLSAHSWQNTTRKRPPQSKPWPNGKAEGASEFQRSTPARPPAVNGTNGPSQSVLSQQTHIMAQNGASRPSADGIGPGRQPVLSLLSLNGSFERKTISVPFYPDTLRIGRQTNAKTVPTPVNGFFDSKVLSRQHAEVWADASGKIWIRDVKSSNGTFVNGTRLSPENRESEPHELQPQDQLELGIDIVSEDQKTVVHHKVAAKVEHAGFVSPSNNPLDMNFGEIDPSNGNLMQGPGQPPRGRSSSQASMGANGRAPPANMGGPLNGMAQQRQFWLNPITTEHIAEMRNARLQNQDLARTSQFISALLSKDDVRNQDKPEPQAAEPPKTQPLTNGNLSFRSDGGKTRFSEPPAPPPSQPLPEKPDISRPASEVPSLKRGTTERPKSHPPNTSPTRPDSSLNQIMQLTEALNNAKKELDNHTARVRDLEEKLTKEREARQLAEDMVQKMEENSHATTLNGSAGHPMVNGHSELEKAFDLPAERPSTPETVAPAEPVEASSPQPDKVEALAAAFQARIDSMTLEMSGLREQLEAFRLRAEKAEADRDADRKTLAEMVEQIRQRDEEEAKRAAERKSRSLSRARSRAAGLDEKGEAPPAQNGTATKPIPQHDGAAAEAASVPTLSRANTITPTTSALATSSQDPAIMQTLPYASMIGVVLIGMGLMAYLNGWQPQAKLDH